MSFKIKMNYDFKKPVILMDYYLFASIGKTLFFTFYLIKSLAQFISIVFI